VMRVFNMKSSGLCSLRQTLDLERGIDKKPPT
jgi:hypothetical protein